jgi:oligosaccharyltransferase complex subunit beta
LIVGLGPNLTPKILLDFINADGNILVTMASTHNVPSSISSFLNELDITLPAERTASVVDHFYYDTVSAAESHDVLVLDAPQNVRPGLKNYFEIPGSVLSVPHAIGHTLGSGPLLTPILRAPATAYSYNPKEQETLDEDLFAAGQQLSLISVAQARNSARVTILGAAEMLQDKWIEAKVARPSEKAQYTSNREFITSLSAWAFKELGVLRVNSIEHQLKDSDEVNPEIYRIKNEVVSFRTSLVIVLPGTANLRL